MEPSLVHKFRNYGLPLCYIVYVCSVFIANRRAIDGNEECSACETYWIWTIRLSVWSTAFTVLSLISTILFYKTPPVVDNAQNKDDVIGKTEVHALVIRIVTIGNYKKMVQDSIRYHSDLVQRFLRCRFFYIHLVTEKPLNLQRVFPDFLRETVVPKDYATKSGSMGKARNLAYWSETNQLGDLPEDRTWIIDLDEDVILTESFMRSLSRQFLKDQTKPKIGLPQVITKFNEQSSYIIKLVELHRFSFDLSLHWPSMVLLNRPPNLCHGGSYVARADCSMDKNAECGTFCSVSDDNAYILSMRSKNIKLEFIDGWYLEEGPISTAMAIVQRARWQRGHLYLLWHAPVSMTLKLGLLATTVEAVVLLPLFNLARLMILIAWMTGHCGQFWPSLTEEPTLLGQLTTAMIATQNFSMIYGSWHLLPWREAIIVSLFSLTGIPLVIVSIFYSLTAVLAYAIAVKEISSGKMSWKATEKLAN